MSQLFNNEQKLNDIIFADRNKSYGAYALRSAYGNTILKSVLLMMLGVGSIFSLAFYYSNKNNQEPDYSEILLIKDTVYVVQFNKEEEQKPEEQEIEEPVEKEEEPTSSESESVTVVDSTFEATKTNTTEIVGPTSTSTLATDVVSTPKEKHTGGKGDSNGVDTSIVHEPFVVDQGPEFEGGLSELYKFVIRHLKYPNKAYMEGKGGTVYVKFVVDEKGNVGRLTLLNAIGYDMDEEALRVVSMIPQFKSPAMVKGQPVKTYYQLPIRFRYSN